MYPFIVITHILLKPSTHYRINLSPFTKDFRVWGALIETNSIYLRPPSGGFYNAFIDVTLQSLATHPICNSGTLNIMLSSD